MNELIDFLRHNPLLAIFLGLWLLSALANAGARALRKTQQRPKTEEADRPAEVPELRRARPAEAPEPPMTRPVAASEPRRPRPGAVPSADEIAAEIRRLIGGKQAAEAESEPEVEEELQTRPTPLPQPMRKPLPAVVVQTVTVAPRSAPAMSEAAVVLSRPRSGRRRTGRRFLDLADPAAAVVAMEVLGPPRALRGWE